MLFCHCDVFIWARFAVGLPAPSVDESHCAGEDDEAQAATSKSDHKHLPISSRFVFELLLELLVSVEQPLGLRIVLVLVIVRGRDRLLELSPAHPLASATFLGAGAPGAPPRPDAIGLGAKLFAITSLGLGYFGRITFLAITSGRSGDFTEAFLLATTLVTSAPN